MAEAPRFRILELRAFERPVRLRLPFRFGAVTLDAAPQAFVLARIAGEDGREATGMTAELMIPKWFDKRPGLSNARNVDDLRAAVAAAVDAYAADRDLRTAFGHAAARYAGLMADGARRDIEPLAMAYGGALADRALLDALCRAQALPFAAALRANLPGIDAALAPDLDDFAFDAFLAGLAPVTRIAARHTVGLLDALTERPDEAPDDGLPATLAAAIRRYGHRHFKIKLCGRPEADAARLAAIAAVLDDLPGYAVTLDGNEQFADVATLEATLDAAAADPRLLRLWRAVRFVEQPLPRERALAADVAAVARRKPLLIDESDATYDAFPQARARGYAGVSSKNCKGPYKSIVNAARVARWNGDPRSVPAGGAPGPAFLSGEDLTTQAGLALQQDLALVGALGLADVERNGHHYGDGFAAQGASAAEARAFAAAHPDLYRDSPQGPRVAIRGGMLDFASLDRPGFGSAAFPDLDTLAPLAPAAPRVAAPASS